MDNVNTTELEEKVVAINRVTKVVKGGRRFSFAALVVVGDKIGQVGFGSGKAGEVPEAIGKATRSAKKSCHDISLKNGTIPHEVIGKFGAAKVIMKPAAAGTARTAPVAAARAAARTGAEPDGKPGCGHRSGRGARVLRGRERSHGYRRGAARARAAACDQGGCG